MTQQQTLTLTDFLLARIAEDERAASGLNGATRIIGQRPNFYGAGGPAAEGHWEQFNPDRMLAECEAKRRLVELHTAGEHVWQCPGESVEWSELRNTDDGPWLTNYEWCRTLCLVALTYARHPDYRDEWRP